MTVAFTDSSSNTPTSWLWERTSDGITWSSFSTSQNPSQSFAAGTWGVRLTATNAGGSDTKTRKAYINARVSSANRDGLQRRMEQQIAEENDAIILRFVQENTATFHQMLED